MEVVLYLLIITYGLVIGSFLNVLILRIPAGEDFVMERSHCVKCGYQLTWYDMVPVFSYLCLKGRCRKCGEPISKQYPLVEALNAVLYFLVFFYHGINVESGIYSLVASALLVISVIDFRTFEIPLGLTIFIAVLGVVATIVDFDQLALHLIGMCSVGLVLEILFIASAGNWVGGGDATLMMAAGLVIGWQKITAAFFIACILGSVIHSIRMKLSEADHVLALGPYLSMGICIMMIWGDRLISWYVSLLGW